jgi:hypothetical protein
VGWLLRVSDVRVLNWILRRSLSSSLTVVLAWSQSVGSLAKHRGKGQNDCRLRRGLQGCKGRSRRNAIDTFCILRCLSLSSLFEVFFLWFLFFFFSFLSVSKTSPSPLLLLASQSSATKEYNGNQINCQSSLKRV